MSVNTCLIYRCFSSASAVRGSWFIYELQKSTTIAFSRNSLYTFYFRNPTCGIPPCLRISNRKYPPMPSEFHNREPPLPFGNPKSRPWYSMDIFWNRPICFAQNNEKQFYLYQSSSCSLASSARSHISFSSRLKSPAFSSSSQFIPFSSSPVVEICDSSPSLSPLTSSSSSACFALTGFTDPVWFHCAFAMLFLKASWASLISDIASFSFPSV